MPLWRRRGVAARPRTDVVLIDGVWRAVAAGSGTQPPPSPHHRAAHPAPSVVGPTAPTARWRGRAGGEAGCTPSPAATADGGSVDVCRHWCAWWGGNPDRRRPSPPRPVPWTAPPATACSGENGRAAGGGTGGAPTARTLTPGATGPRGCGCPPPPERRSTPSPRGGQPSVDCAVAR